MGGSPISLKDNACASASFPTRTRLYESGPSTHCAAARMLARPRMLGARRENAGPLLFDGDRRLEKGRQEHMNAVSVQSEP
jgi:hypothetical protein